MPRKNPGFINNKQELFCRFVARGETYTKSYELAGYAPSTSNASNLAARPDIKARIAELKEEYIRDQAMFEAALAVSRRDDADNDDPNCTSQKEIVEWTANRVMDLIAENVRLAQIAGSYGAANDALKMLGEALGMFEKAKADKSPAANPLAFIGRVINQLPAAADEYDIPVPAKNPLAPAADE